MARLADKAIIRLLIPSPTTLGSLQASCSHVMHYATSATSAVTVATSETNQTQDATKIDWTQHVQPVFSARPAYLSSSYHVYLQSKEAHERRQLLGHSIKASSSLAYDIDGLDDVQIEQIVRYRIKQLKAWCGELSSLNSPSYLPPCEDKSLLFGYYQLLEQNAKGLDRDSEEFSEVYAGKEDAWNYWLRRFGEKYSGTPSLQKLEVVYSKADAQQVLSEAKEVLTKTRKDAILPVPLPPSELATSGFRKTSRAQVHITPGSGRISVNGLPYDKYFQDYNVRALLLQPFFVTNRVGQFDVEATVQGGGLSGQAQAIRHGISKALVVYNPLLTKDLRKLIKRDDRIVERKKPGRRKARRGFQWVKR